MFTELMNYEAQNFYKVINFVMLNSAMLICVLHNSSTSCKNCKDTPTRRLSPFSPLNHQKIGVQF